MRVLLACYRCDGAAGTEARGAAAWIAGLSGAGLSLTVLTRTPAAAVNPTLAGLSGVDVVSMPGPDSPGRTDERSLRRDYLRWDRAVRTWLAGQYLSRFDLAHHLSWGSVTAPTALALAGSLPLVWGPVGGGQHCPLGLVRLMPPVAAGRELARSSRLRAARWLPWVRRAATTATVTLATNDETAGLLRRLGARQVWSMPDTAVPTVPAPAGGP
ncbi:MAG TPA: hypothetical protein VFX70_03320, partial [Mycobacteriales bacterium]|nr:hypothetical protein [Mycobacteriales bacterium]